MCGVCGVCVTECDESLCDEERRMFSSVSAVSGQTLLSVRLSTGVQLLDDKRPAETVRDTHAHTHTPHTDAHTHTQMHAHTHTQMHAHAHTRSLTHTDARTLIHTTPHHTMPHTRTHTHRCTLTHTHTLTQHHTLTLTHRPQNQISNIEPVFRFLFWKCMQINAFQLDCASFAYLNSISDLDVL